MFLTTNKFKHCLLFLEDSVLVRECVEQQFR